MELERKTYFITQEAGGWLLRRRTPKQTDDQKEDWESKLFKLTGNKLAVELIEHIAGEYGVGEKLLPRDVPHICLLLQQTWEFGGGVVRAEPKDYISLQQVSGVYDA